MASKKWKPKNGERVWVPMVVTMDGPNRFGNYEVGFMSEGVFAFPAKELRRRRAVKRVR